MQKKAWFSPAQILVLRGYKSPTSLAGATALMRLLTSNLLLMFLVWVFTVFKEMKSFSEISLFDNPAAMRCKTSNSRSLRQFLSQQ
jgi:hypothetical protein